MTIAIGGLWPWGGQDGFPQLPPPPYPQLPQSAILVVDSRWSMTQRNHIVGHKDVGAKLFQLTRYAGAVYAGDVEAGERCLHTIAKSFSRNEVRAPAPLGVAERLRTSYNNSRSQGRLLILVGVGRLDGVAELWYFSSDDNFRPIQRSGVYVIASDVASQAFKDGLQADVADALKNRNGVDLKANTGLVWLVSALADYVLEPKIDVTVGGPIQAAIMNANGFQRVDISRTRNPAVGWERMTVAKQEVRTLFPRLRREKRPRATPNLITQQVID